MDAIKARLTELEQQVIGIRRVVTALLESLPLESKEREELLTELEVKVEELEDLPTSRSHHEKSIRQLLDESQAPGGARK